MKTLIKKVQSLSLKARQQTNKIDFLDNQLKDKQAQDLIRTMNSISLKELGIIGTTAEEDPNHFKAPLSRVTIDGNDDYRLVLFFIKKGQVMPLHDHPNMSVYFKLMFGKLSYHSYDKVDDKFKYNRFSEDEHAELLESYSLIDAKKSRQKMLHQNNLLVVRPSIGNMHKFKAECDSCFFDIMLPNYSDGCSRKITYFNDLSEHISHVNEVEEHLMGMSGLPVMDFETDKERFTKLQFFTTPPVLPFKFDIAELDYQGDYNEIQNFHSMS